MIEPANVQKSMAIDGSVYLLAQSTDLDRLSQEVASAARTGAEFVTIHTDASAEIRVLVTSISVVSIASKSLPADPEEYPFGRYSFE